MSGLISSGSPLLLGFLASKLLVRIILRLERFRPFRRFLHPFRLHWQGAVCAAPDRAIGAFGLGLELVLDFVDPPLKSIHQSRETFRKFVLEALGELARPRFETAAGEGVTASPGRDLLASALLLASAASL